METDPSPPRAPGDTQTPCDALRLVTEGQEGRGRRTEDGGQRTEGGQASTDRWKPATDRRFGGPETGTTEGGAAAEAAHPVFQQALEILRRDMPAKTDSERGCLVERAQTADHGTETAATTDSERAQSQNLETEPPVTPPCDLCSPPPAQIIPARMLNEFVYCPRLFYYEFVESVFVESVDTVRGKALHRRVDSGKGDLPPAGQQRSGVRGQKSEARGQRTEDGGRRTEGGGRRTEDGQASTEEVIHSRSVQMGSSRLGVTAKMDLVEVRVGTVSGKTGKPGETGDLFAALEVCPVDGKADAPGSRLTPHASRFLEVCPVDYKVGAPREGEDANELWDTDRMQLGVQALILRDNGYSCNEGVIYYRETKQRVRLPITPELALWVEERIGTARQAAAAAIPPPLVASPKCPRCSLVSVCLPDETRLLTESAPQPRPVRRLMAARDDSRALYLSTQGLRVGRKDEVLQIKQEKVVLDEVRINDVSHVALFGNIQITTQAIQTLCELEVPVTYFSMGGWFYGLTRGHELKNVFLRIEQFRLARDPATCLRLARQFVQGKIRNHRTMLMRNHVEAPPATLLKLKQYAEAASRAESIESLLGVEGGAAAAYFEQLGGMIKLTDELDDQLPGLEMPSRQAFTFNFHFNGRNRRPPTDPVNAMLSLAYSLLAKDCLLAALAVGFDPYVGFYHQPRFGRPALALDLMEEFRPLVAESAVLTCINNRVVSENDFVQAGQAVNLTAAGRKRFFQTYEQRMSALLTHPIFDYKVSYRRALELQARLLAKVLTGEIPEYIPLTTR